MADRIFYRDLPLDITINSQGDVSELVNADSIKQSINMIIETARGTRIFLPNYGAKIRSFLFEPFDEETARRMGEELQYTITNYEKRIQLLNLNINMNYKNTSYDVIVIYRVINTDQVDTTQVTLEKL